MHMYMYTHIAASLAFKEAWTPTSPTCRWWVIFSRSSSQHPWCQGTPLLQKNGETAVMGGLRWGPQSLLGRGSESSWDLILYCKVLPQSHIQTKQRHRQMPFIAVDCRAGDYKSRRIKQALLRGKDSLYKHKYLEDSKGKQKLTKLIFT